LIPIDFPSASFAPAPGTLSSLASLEGNNLIVYPPTTGPVRLLSADFAEYDPTRLAGNEARATNALGHVTTYTYEANGRRLSESKTRTVRTIIVIGDIAALEAFRYLLVPCTEARAWMRPAYHHVMARGMERQRIFREDQDCEDFVQRVTWPNMSIVIIPTKPFSTPV
jgi:YD repeat-containing protein